MSFLSRLDGSAYCVVEMLGNETIEGSIHLPAGYKTGFQAMVKLHSDTSSGELTALPNAEGGFSFRGLRPDSYQPMN